MPTDAQDALPVVPESLGRPVHWLLGLPFDALTLEQAVARIADAVKQRTPLFLSTPNLNFLIASQHNAEFQRSVLNSDLSVADGMPIVWLARLLGVPIPERVAGSDIFEALMRGEAGPIKIYLFGGDQGVAAQAAARINAADAAVRCVGHHSPGFGSIEEMSTPAIVDAINASEADFVLVALGAAKGQAWIEYNRRRLAAPVISHLGAVINFAAGCVSRAPAWMQKSGLEWLWRIKEEPRLVGRYARDGIRLAALGVRNVVPLMVMRRRGEKRAGRACAARIERTAEQVTLELSGEWNAAARAALIREIIASDEAGSPCKVRIEGLTGADSSLLGLIYLLTRRSVPIRVIDGDQRKRWYRLNKAEALVGAG